MHCYFSRIRKVSAQPPNQLTLCTIGESEDPQQPPQPPRKRAISLTAGSRFGRSVPTANGGRRFSLAGVRDPMGWRPSMVDLYSRIVFPVTFALFHVVYWSTCFLCLEALPGDVTLLKRH